jgi:hypothetical protein
MDSVAEGVNSSASFRIVDGLVLPLSHRSCGTEAAEVAPEVRSAEFLKTDDQGKRVYIYRLPSIALSRGPG